MNSKRIGNIGEAKVLSKFVELGIPVYIPFGDNERIDLIAEFNGVLNRIQVKTSNSINEDNIRFDIVSSTMHRNNGIKHFYNKNEIDYIACYSILKNEIYLIDINEANTQAIIFRYNTPKNNQVLNIRYASDYLLEDKIKGL